MKCIKKTVFGAGVCLLLTSCATKLPPPPGNHHLDPGWYIFDCDALHYEGLCEVTKIAPGYNVNLREGFAGDFELHTTRTRNEVIIKNAHVNNRDLKRTLSGEGYMRGNNTATGTAASWIKMSRDKRKERTWSLRPATEREVRKVHERLKARANSKK
ncbi:MAG: hypothetical protein VCG02_20440 [Verrucomicrobiota bacterium]